MTAPAPAPVGDRVYRSPNVPGPAAPRGGRPAALLRRLAAKYRALRFSWLLVAEPGAPCEDPLGPLTVDHDTDRRGRCRRCGLVIRT